MVGNEILMVVAFAAASSLVMLVYLVIGARNRRMEGRIQTLADRKQPSATAAQPTTAPFAKSMSKIGSPLMPGDEEARTRLTSRLLHAGIYARSGFLSFWA